MQGKIKKIVTDKHFGFIEQEGENKDVFFHSSNLDGASFEELQEGDAVTFDIEQGDKGPAAVNVKKA